MPRLSGQPYSEEGKPFLDESGYMVEPAGWRKRKGATGRKPKREQSDGSKRSAAPGLSSSEKLKAAIAEIEAKSGVNLPAFKAGPSRRAEPPIPGLKLGGLTQRDRIVAALAAQCGGRNRHPRYQMTPAGGKEAPTRLLGRSRRFPGIPSPVEEVQEEVRARDIHPNAKVSFTPRRPNTRVTPEGEEIPVGRKPQDIGKVEGEAYGKFGTDEPAPFDNILEEKRKAAIEEQKIEAELRQQKAINASLARNTAFEEQISPDEEPAGEEIKNPLIGESTKEAARAHYGKKALGHYTKGMPEKMAAKVKAFIAAHPGVALPHVSEFNTSKFSKETEPSSSYGDKLGQYSEIQGEEGFDESQADQINLADIGDDRSMRTGALSAPALLGDAPTIGGRPLAQQGQERYSAPRVKPRIPRPEGTLKQAVPMSQEKAKELVGTKGAPITLAQKMRKLIKSNPRLVVYAKGKRDLSKIKSEKEMAEANKPADIKPSGKRKLTAGENLPKAEEITKVIGQQQLRSEKKPYGGGMLSVTPPKDTPATEHVRGFTKSEGKTGKQWQAGREEISKIAELAKQIQKEKMKEEQSRRAMAHNKARRKDG